MYKAAGAISDDEMLTFRQFGSRIEGHPTPVLPWVDVATGSLGQGLPIAVGVALTRASCWTGCRTGSGACAATPRWPRARCGRRSSTAGFHGLDNLTAIIDVNRLGQTGETMHGWDLDAYRAPSARRSAGRRSRSTATTSPPSTRPTPRRSRSTGRPTVIIAQDREGPRRHGGRQPARQATASRSTTRRRPSPSSAACATSTSRSPSPSVDGQPARVPDDGALTCRRTSRAPRRPRARHSATRWWRSATARGDVVALDGEVGN